MPLLCSRLLPGRDSRDSWVGPTCVAGGRNQRRGTGTSLDHALSCRVPFLRMNGVHLVVAEGRPKLVPPYTLQIAFLVFRAQSQNSRVPAYHSIDGCGMPILPAPFGFLVLFSSFVSIMK